ncbi:Transcription factor tau subunit [Candida viswanathii]|uniref:Transcription factor tau subunit n=1 Tax=Candida viswanathii TaxID=5486 RepID=A0A367Y1K0_9ASCO|nr:Transcription factor tau subunit [Candida viswanathii]
MPELERPDEHSMDIPRVAAIDLPLNVKNVDKAINMLGGESFIRASMRDNQPLELRLRKDPFHHPVQALTSTNERILLKVRIPKKSLPENASSLSIRDLIKLNREDNTTPRERIQPVAIIDKTYLFKAISDFQVSTKNNQFVQEFNKVMLNYKKFDDIKDFADTHNSFDNYADINEDYFKNQDHQLIPPPILSPIRFPFDYKYQKNPSTSTVKDARGELKVVSKKDRQKLHTLLIDYNTPIPTEPADAIKEKWAKLKLAKLNSDSTDYLLLKCINRLKELFDAKPIWNRKQLLDIVEVDIRRFIKHALPYVTFIYRSGPWRFCNIKYGVDVTRDSKYWPYQTEYFRVTGLKDAAIPEGSKKITPPTLKDSAAKIEVSEHLLFNGVSLPSVTTFQIGDILDEDILAAIEYNQGLMGDSFLRDTCDFQDGWVNRQTMEVIRGIMRYKLQRMVKDEVIDRAKIDKITHTDYTAEKEGSGEIDDKNGHEEEAEVEEDDDEEEEEEVDVTHMDIQDEEDTNESEIINKLGDLGTDTSNRLSKLVGFIKQDSIENQDV